MTMHSMIGFMNIGGMEWGIILIIALLLFGRRLPEVMRGLGGGVREFRRGLENGAEDPGQALPNDGVARQGSDANVGAQSQAPAAGAANESNGGSSNPSA